MRTILSIMAIALAGLTDACGRDDIKSYEQTRAQFLAQRVDFERLADKALLCEGPTHIDRRRRHDTQPCAGGKVTREEIEGELKRLKLWGVRWEKDGSSVSLINGEHYNPSFDVGAMSEMVRYSKPQEDPRGEALTPPPHYWLYSEHD